MNYKFEQEFRKDNPQTIGETDKHYDLDNYKDWLESKLSEALKPQQSKSAEENFRAKQSEMPKEELCTLFQMELSKLCKTGGKSLTMSVPPKVTDFDMLASELLSRFILQTTAKEKEFCEALERMKANSFSREEIERLQSSVYEITGKGEVMKLFNSLLGVAAG